jgi:acetoin utilization deacetylase AcuC-like enzyme
MVTALKLKSQGLMRRIGILDCDQHFGDGTDHIIERLRAGDWVRHVSAGRHYKREARTFLQGLPAFMQGFADCDVLLYQAGADPHVDDPLGGYLDDDQLARRDAIVFAHAHRLGIPIAWNLAGGYQQPLRNVLDIHDRTMAACVREYVGAPAKEEAH